VELLSSFNNCSLTGHHDVSVAVWFIRSIEDHYGHSLVMDWFEGSSFSDFKVYADVGRWRKREGGIDRRGSGGRSRRGGRSHVLFVRSGIVG
jgi:hypothetical protein